jgi:hypothetical protein
VVQRCVIFMRLRLRGKNLYAVPAASVPAEVQIYPYSGSKQTFFLNQSYSTSGLGLIFLMIEAVFM